MKLLSIVIFFILFRLSTQKSTKDSRIYIGGVIQSNPMAVKQPEVKRRESFAKHYNLTVKLGHQRNLDIIVLPEHLLTITSKLNLLEDKPPSYVKYDETDNNIYYETKVEEFSKLYRSFCRNVAFVIPNNYIGTIICKIKEFNTNIKYNMTDLEMLSCSARQYSMYLVASHYERVNCYYFNPEHKCPSDGFYLYSTSLVFDREGRLIARYRKHNKFDEPWIDVPEHTEPVIFKTDFNVTFGLLLGLDVYEQKIINAYAKDHYKNNLTDFIIATSEPELPFFITSYDMVDYAHDSNVNLLVAGFAWDDSDSSIYTGLNEPQRVLTEPYLPISLIFKNITKKNIPKSSKNDDLLIDANNNNQSDDPNFLPIFEGEDPQLELMPGNWTLSDFAHDNTLAFSPLNPNDGSSLNAKLCSNKLCCEYSLNWSYNKRIVKKSSIFYTYGLVAVRGVYKLMNGTVVSIELCGIMACTNNTIDSCGKRIDPAKSVIHPIKFHSILISRQIGPYGLQNTLSSPLAFKFNGLIKRQSYDISYNFHEQNLELRLKNSMDKLMIFGINTRIFNVDKPPVYKYQSSYVGHFVYDYRYYIMIIFVVSVTIFIGITYYFSRKMKFDATSLKDMCVNTEGYINEVANDLNDEMVLNKEATAGDIKKSSAPMVVGLLTKKKKQAGKVKDDTVASNVIVESAILASEISMSALIAADNAANNVLLTDEDENANVDLGKETNVDDVFDKERNEKNIVSEQVDNVDDDINKKIRKEQFV